MDIDALKQHRSTRFFEGWDGFVSAERINTSERIGRYLVDTFSTAGPSINEPTVCQAVRYAVARFNEADDGWIATIEREDICDQLSRVTEIAGFGCEDGWLDGRDW